MNVTVKEFIDNMNALYPNRFGVYQYLKWINDIESSIYTEEVKKLLVEYRSLKKNVSQYNFPTDIGIDDIEKVYVRGREYYKLDSSFYKERGYWEENGKINIYPLPSESDNSYINPSYTCDELDALDLTCNELDELNPFSNLTFTTNTITNGDFSGFSVGDIVIISGCVSQPSNNKIAQIVSVSNDTLTFEEGTFIPVEIETGTVTIKVATMKIVYRYIPKPKTLSNVTVDTLLLPRQFLNLYEYYIYAQIAYIDKEYKEYEQHMSMYAMRLKAFRDWYSDHRALYSDTEIDSGFGYSSSKGFDYE